METGHDTAPDHSKIEALLARLYDTQKLYASNAVQPSAHKDLVELVAGLLSLELSEREGDIVSDVLISLMRQAAEELCVTLSERLSVMDNVPLRLILHISNQAIHVAEPVLRHSDVFGDMDLLYIIRSKGAEYWRTIATRKQLNDRVIDSLAECDDFETAYRLAKNSNILLTPYAWGRLSDEACKSEMLADTLLHRDDADKDVAEKLYAYVGAALKSYIKQNFDLEIEQEEVVDEVLLDFSVASDDDRDGMPSQAHLNVAALYKKRGNLTADLMLRTLKRSQLRSFVAQFAVHTDLEPLEVIRLIERGDAKSLAAICKASDINRNDFITFHLLTSRLHSTGSMLEAKDLHRIIKYYDTLDPRAARATLLQLQQASGQPLH